MAKWQSAVLRSVIVWVGNDHFLQRVNFDKQFWTDELLPKLLTFYAISALPYLQEKGKPNVASSLITKEAVTTMDGHQFEDMLAHDLHQSRIGKRKGELSLHSDMFLFVEKTLSADQHTMLSDMDALRGDV